MAKHLPTAGSITYLHLAAILNSEVPPELARPVRILDAGCGTGKLLEHLVAVLPVLRPDVNWEFFGFDVTDTGVQTDQDFLAEARTLLAQADPTGQWAERIVSIRVDDEWPWSDDHFDAVISNQVLEHVHDLDAFIKQLSRVLAPDGTSAHIFPVRSTLTEGHVRVPLVHKLRTHDAMIWWIRMANRLGLGRFATYNRPGDTAEQFAEKEADRIWNYTRYRTAAEILNTCRNHELRASWRYTPDLYAAKLRSMRHIDPVYSLGRRKPVIEAALPTLLKYASGMTLFLQKRNTVPPAAGGH